MFGAYKFSIDPGRRHPGFNDIGTIVSTVAPAVISGAMGSSAADAQASAAQQAAATSAASADKATQLQREMWLAQQSAQAPYQAVGQQSINALAGLMGVTPNVPAPDQQYAGMNRNQLIAALAPQYTTKSNIQAQSQVTPATYSMASADNIPRLALTNRPQPAAAPVSSVNQAALNARVDQILKQQQDYAQAQQMRQSPDFGVLARDFSMADYQADPGYAFRLKEGMKSLEQGAAARGGVLSGNMLRGAQEYGQGLASQEYQNAYNRYQTNQGNKFNRLASLAGVGQTATSALGQAGQNYASNVGNIGMSSAANQGNAMLAAGQARASSLQGVGQALGGVNWGQVGSGINNLLGGNNYASNMGGVNTSLAGFYNPVA